MRYLKKFNESEVNQEKVNCNIEEEEEEARESTGSEYNEPLLKFRIIKESISNVDIESYLAYLIDDGFTIYKKNVIFKNSIHIYKLNNSELSENINNLQMLDNDKLEMEIIPFIELFKNDIESISMSCKSNEYYRVKLTPDIIIKRGFTENIIKIVIILK
jgi:hypothetical protein